MEYKEIKKLMDDVGNSKLSQVEIEFPDGTKINFKKNEEKVILQQNNSENLNNSNLGQMNPIISNDMVKNESVSDVQKQNELIDNLKIVKSPMVGTFYAKSSPTARSFVEIGTKVKKGDTLCIIEAMKLMNEIESEYDGEIVEILVKDGEAVDYGRELFKVKGV